MYDLGLTAGGSLVAALASPIRARAAAEALRRTLDPKQVAQTGCPSAALWACENFLYVFKAARWAARAADSAHRLRSRWRSRYGGDERRSGWRESTKPLTAMSSAITRIRRGAACLAPAVRIVRVGQNLSRAPSAYGFAADP